MEKNKRILIFSILILLTLPFSVSADGGLDFSITEWDTGSLEPGIVTTEEVGVTNNTESTVEIMLVSTCGCMTTSDEILTLAPGEGGSFTILFDSSDDEGDFEKILIIQTDSPAMPKGFFIVTGSVDLPQSTGDKALFPASAEEGAVVSYFYTPGCRSCNEFLHQAEIGIDRFDITIAGHYEQMQEQLSVRGEALRAVPVMITPTAVFQGEDEIVEGYKALIEGRVAVIPVSRGNTVAGISLTVFPVIIAGLLDGVNPCAFTTLIFLLSALTVAGRSRRETLVIGLFFTLSVFLTYYLIGLGFFKIIRIADSFELVSRVIRWVLFAVLLIFAGLSFYDYTKIRSGRVKDIILQLPGGVKRRMHDSIRTYTKSAALAASSIVMGVLISIFELGCTGQIYFPTITYIIQTDKAASGYLFLALYNLAFILPLAAVFITVYFGITSKRITKTFQKNLGSIKVLTGLLFLGFAALMLIF